MSDREFRKNLGKAFKDSLLYIFSGQVQAIRGITMAKVACDNTPMMEAVQSKAFLLPDSRWVVWNYGTCRKNHTSWAKLKGFMAAQAKQTPGKIYTVLDVFLSRLRCETRN